MTFHGWNAEIGAFLPSITLRRRGVRSSKGIPFFLLLSNSKKLVGPDYPSRTHGSHSKSNRTEVDKKLQRNIMIGFILGVLPITFIN